jgi:hypothetical protein
MGMGWTRGDNTIVCTHLLRKSSESAWEQKMRRVGAVSLSAGDVSATRKVHPVGPTQSRRAYEAQVKGLLLATALA